MGQGYSLTTLSAGSAGIDVPELSDLTFENALGEARFMKAIRARHRDGLVVAKVVMKPYASLKFQSYIDQIMRERNLLTDVPNVLCYHQAFETSSNGYLVRQFIYSSVYERFSLRPFLEDIEKRWIAFQLLSAVRDCHSKDLFHGDIKTENMLLTSWNWLYLTDFSASFKPTYLPEDNPADYSFYFDISGRRTCYLAPERFLKPGERGENKGGLTWAMDIFSTGCAIAELFLEGPLFNLSQLFRYRNGEFNPEQTVLQRIEDEGIREMVAHMINLDPESRYSAQEYLNFWRQRTFPEYFYNFLHQYMHLMTDPTSGRAAITASKANLGESDERIERIYFDYEKIAFFLGYDETQDHIDHEQPELQLAFSMFPLHLDLPNKRDIARLHPRPTLDDGTLLFLDLVLSSCRSTARTAGKIRACELMLAFSMRLPEDARLDRVLPFLIDLLKDPVDAVKAAALRTLTQILVLIDTTSPANANIFPEYVFHYVKRVFGESSSTLVRATLASCLGPLSQAALHLLDINFALKADGPAPSRRLIRHTGADENGDEDTYDMARNDLVRFFETHTRFLLDDPDPDVRRALLGSVPPLCVFFGSAKASDVILVHINTYLNDANFQLKGAFFETVVGVATYVGGASLEEYILPLMLQSLADSEEAIIEKCIRSLAAIAELGLFERSCIWGLVELVARFTMHPNIWIREATAQFVSASTRFLTAADCECIIKPILEPYLRRPVASYSETSLLDGLKKPLPRIVFDLAMTWASRADKGSFWKTTRPNNTALIDQIAYPPSRELHTFVLSRLCRHEEDQQWVGRLKTAGMLQEDEMKLIALQEFIAKSVRIRRPKDENELQSNRMNKIVSLKDLQIAPETVFFGEFSPTKDDTTRRAPWPSAAGPSNPAQTIQDALLDASTTIDAPMRKTPTTMDHSPAMSTARSIRASGAHIPSPIVGSPYAGSPLKHETSIIEQAALMARHSSTQATGTKRAAADAAAIGSPAGESDTASVASTKARIRQSRSAIDLMQRQSKAAASTEASTTHVEGRLDRTQSRDLSPRIMPTISEKAVDNRHLAHRGAHTYAGRDPAVLKLLNSLYLDNFPTDMAEFGPRVASVEQRQRERKLAGAVPPSRWRPTGTFVALLAEHAGAVTCVLPAPDHAFFLSGSEDGSVRVWDTARLERNLSHRSRAVHRHEADAKVTALCFIEQTHCFVSAATDGSIHIVRVDYTDTSSGAKYGKLRVLRRYQLPEEIASEAGAYGVAIEHYRHEATSTLLVATSASTVHAIDIRSMTPLFSLQNPIHHGALTALTTDTRHHWLLVGTSHGVLDLWDLRFRLRVRSFAFAGSSPIHALRLHPVRGSRKRQVLVAGGTGTGDVTVWDLEKLACKEVYRTAAAAQHHAAVLDPRAPATPAALAAAALKPYTPATPDAQSRAATLAQFATTPSAADAPPPDRGVRALAVGARHAPHDPDRSDPRHGFFVAAGPDRKVRFWDMDHVEGSSVVSGLAADEAPPGYASMVAGVDCVVSEERAATGARADKAKASRSSVVSMQQQRLLRSHLDTVTAVALVEWPCCLVVSADRAGRVYVFS